MLHSFAVQTAVLYWSPVHWCVLRTVIIRFETDLLFLYRKRNRSMHRCECKPLLFLSQIEIARENDALKFLRIIRLKTCTFRFSLHSLYALSFSSFLNLPIFFLMQYEISSMKMILYVVCLSNFARKS